MANLIKCPNCGENNLSDREFCQYCQNPLRPLAGEGNQPLTPGQSPTKKNTSELEPVLPQWLQDARSSARQSAGEETPKTPPSRSIPSADLLAGLRAQRQAEDEEEETPDWLANITGETPKPKKPQAEPTTARRVELGDTKDFAQSEPEPELPSWMTGSQPPAMEPDQKDELADWLREPDATNSLKQTQPFPVDNRPSSPPAAGDTPDWLRSMVADEGAGFNDTGSSAEETFSVSDTPDWLRGLDAGAPLTGSNPPAFSDTPDWLRTMAAENGEQNANPPADFAAPSDTPDWLRAMADESGGQNINPPADFAAPSDTPDWLQAMADESGGQNANPPADFATPSDTPDWMRGLGAENAAQDVSPLGDAARLPAFSESGLSGAEDAFSPVGDTPDWLKDLEPSQPSSDQDWLKSFQSAESEPSAAAEQPAPQPPASEEAELDIPSWLKAAAPQSSIFTEPPEPQEAATPSDSELPDWLNVFKPEDQAAPSTAEPVKVESPSFGEAAKPADSDSLFTEMPDWLSVANNTAATESVPAPITNTDSIAPGDLPSWVQAMRPVDAGVPQASTAVSADSAFESRGALAGLQGVLPAAPGKISTSKPKAYSIKLLASEEQQAHAALLEQILSAETSPVPIASFFEIKTSRGLRWTLAFLFLVILPVVLFMQTRIFPSPTGFPVEAVTASNVVMESISDDARVLVIFDYDPARAGEVEAIALPMFDRVMRLRYPRLTFISTNETGAILAERFIHSKPLAELGYQSGSQYLNLGYLPGGQMGIRAFAENPIQTAKYPFQNRGLSDLLVPPPPSQSFPPLEGVSLLSNFSTLILITDNADSARAWIEQTTSARGTVPFVVISSSQAAPMIQPYYASGQIKGLASGLYSGAFFEQNDEGRSISVRAYWDAYGVGMLLAVVLILGGGLINLFLGLRDRKAAREEK
ncbi:MAG: hypothetical protein HY865_26835 [Chloroflexi bacterium]|nr:hypothetical protein [Chloroflexota bacterium]